MIRSRKISNEKLIFRLLVVVKSISKCVVNEDHVDSVSVSGESGNQELAADSIHGFAVKAFGILPIQVLFMRFQVQLIIRRWYVIVDLKIREWCWDTAAEART